MSPLQTIDGSCHSHSFTPNAGNVFFCVPRKRIWPWWASNLSFLYLATPQSSKIGNGRRCSSGKCWMNVKRHSLPLRTCLPWLLFHLLHLHPPWQCRLLPYLHLICSHQREAHTYHLPSNAETELGETDQLIPSAVQRNLLVIPISLVRAVDHPRQQKLIWSHINFAL